MSNIKYTCPKKEKKGKYFFQCDKHQHGKAPFYKFARLISKVFSEFWTSPARHALIKKIK